MDLIEVEEDYADVNLIQLSELIGAGGDWLTTVGLGGHEITFLDEQDNVLCGDCADEAFYLGSRDIAGGFMHWEGPTLSCHECGDEIPSIYGDPDEEDEPEDIGKIQSDMARHALKNIRKEAPWILGGID